MLKDDRLGQHVPTLHPSKLMFLVPLLESIAGNLIIHHK